MGIGIAIREGAPKPDITTPDAFRKTLLTQQKVTYSDSKTGGLSGIMSKRYWTILELLTRLKASCCHTRTGKG